MPSICLGAVFQDYFHILLTRAVSSLPCWGQRLCLCTQNDDVIPGNLTPRTGLTDGLDLGMVLTMYIYISVIDAMSNVSVNGVCGWRVLVVFKSTVF